MAKYSVAAMQAKGKNAEDNIFAANNRANALAEKIGKDKVINGTVGSILDEDGQLVMLDVIQRAYKRLTPREIVAYAPIQGYPDFLEDCIDQCHPRPLHERRHRRAPPRRAQLLLPRR